MTLDNDQMLPPRSDLVEQEVEDELFLLDKQEGIVHRLNGGAYMIWLMYDGKRSAEDIAREIAEASSLPMSDVLVDVQETIVQFQTLGLLEPHEKKKTLKPEKLNN